MGSVYVSDVIDQPGGMRYAVRILLFVGIAMVFDGFDYMIVSFTMPQITEEMSLGLIATGSLASFSLLGMLVGGFLSGYLADRFGRKHVMNVSIMVYALLTVPIFFVHSYDAFALCRIFSGLGVGAVIPLSVTMVSEFAPTRYRGTFVTLTKTFMMLGWVIAGVVALFVVPAFGWRMCYLIGGFPFVYGILMHFFMPESVQWLLSRGRTEEALEIVNDINRRLDRPKPGGYSPAEIKALPAQPQGQLREVVSKRYRKVTIGVWLVAFTTCALSYGLTNWMPTVLVQGGYSVQASYGYTTLMNLLGCVGAVAAGVMATNWAASAAPTWHSPWAGLSVVFTAHARLRRPHHPRLQFHGLCHQLRLHVARAHHDRGVPHRDPGNGAGVRDHRCAHWRADHAFGDRRGAGVGLLVRDGARRVPGAALPGRRVHQGVHQDRNEGRRHGRAGRHPGLGRGRRGR